MRSFIITGIVTCLAISGLSRLDAAVELRLLSGDVMVGDISAEDDQTISIKRSVMVKHKAVETVVTVQKNTIAARKEIPSYKEQYKTRAQNTPDILLSQCSLARWCYERALIDEAILHTRKADALEANNPIVAKLFTDLGFVKEENTWVSQDDYLAKTGKVNVGGTIMTKEEAEIAKTKTVQNINAARLEQQIRDAESLIKNGEAKIAEYQALLTKAKSDSEKAKAEATGAKNRYEQAQKRIEERENNNQTNRTKDQNKRDESAASEAKSDFTKATNAQKKAEKEAETADERLKKYKAQLEKAKAELPELKKQLAALAGKTETKDDKATTEAKAENKTDVKTDEKTEKPKSRFGDQ
jgi:DNA repair exonuclease SbcCD ATPase subunit